MEAMMDMDDLIAEAEAHGASCDLPFDEGYGGYPDNDTHNIAVGCSNDGGEDIPDYLVDDDSLKSKESLSSISFDNGNGHKELATVATIPILDAVTAVSTFISTPHQLAAKIREIRNGQAINGLLSSKTAQCAATTEVEFATVSEDKVRRISMHDKSNYLLTTPPLDGDYVTCILPNGSLHYMRLTSNSDVNREAGEVERKTSGFLSTSMEELLKESEALQAQAIVRNANREQKLQDKLAAAAQLDSGTKFSKETVAENNQMWVDKYSPKSFSQLLSSDTANREVLKCLKQWDHYVFKRASPFATSEKPGAGNSADPKSAPPKSEDAQNNMDEKNANSDNDSDSDDDDNGDNEFVKGKSSMKSSSSSKALKVIVDTRPEHKVILLSGPPGTGKTTLAHIIARHCGYNPLEFNASDDRSAESLKELMSKAMTSHSILPNAKPNCVILDEVDGIDGTGAMEALLNIINAPLGRQQPASSKAKSRKSDICLTRPLICICNDQYTPSLRALRPIAKVFVMDAPTEAKLVQRLKSISQKEGLQLSTQALIELCAATGYDIRSSINTLQFASLRASSIVSEPRDMSSAVATLVKAGLKDGQKNIFDIWQEIFNSKELTKSMAARQARAKSSSGKYSRSCPVQEIMLTNADHGDHSLVLSGLHENFLSVRYHDPGFSHTAAVCDWFAFADFFDEQTRTIPGGFQLLQYIYSAAAAVHVHCSQDGRIRLKWPTIERAHSYTHRQNDNILSTFAENVDNKSFLLSSKASLVTEVLAYLSDIIHPRLRPVPPSSWSALEKKAVGNAVEGMVSTGLRYTQSSANANANKVNSFPEGVFGHGAGPALVLEPAVDVLINSYKKFAISVSGIAASGAGMNAHNRRTKANFDTNHVDWADILNRRPAISSETKATLYNELKAFLSRRKDDAKPDTGLASSLSKPAQAINANGSNGSVAHSLTKTNARLHSSAGEKSVIDLAAAENAQKRARLGKLDMFITSSSSSKKTTTSSGQKRGNSALGGTVVGDDKDAIKKAKVRFKFAQGFSDAVRRPVSISEFM